MRILCVGGGTLGPVTPLIAALRSFRKFDQQQQVTWVGTEEGPERDLVLREGYAFETLPTAKLDRFLSIRWLTWPRDYARARQRAKELIIKTQPDLIVGAGGFTQVPIIQLAQKFHIPCTVHQLDATPILSNKLVAKWCTSVTTSLPYLKSPFGRTPSLQIPTPCRYANHPMPDHEAAASRFFFDRNRPTIFVFGGGTGAKSLNDEMLSLWPSVQDEWQLIHLTGTGKSGWDAHAVKKARRLVVHEMFDEQDMAFAYAAADIVVCRGGFGTLSELACWSIPAIVVPLPNSPQEENARRLQEGLLVVEQGANFRERLKKAIEDALASPIEMKRRAEKLHELLPTDDGTALAEVWEEIVRKNV